MFHRLRPTTSYLTEFREVFGDLEDSVQQNREEEKRRRVIPLVEEAIPQIMSTVFGNKEVNELSTEDRNLCLVLPLQES
jgi:citrate lyase beta subunit